MIKKSSLVLFLVLLIPFVKFINFLFKEYIGLDPGLSNYLKLILLFLFMYEYRKKKETLLLVGFFVFYTIYGRLSFTNNLLYVINYTLTVYAFIYFGDFVKSGIKFFDKHRKLIAISILVFYGSYLFSVIIKGPTLKGSGLAERIYFDGFIIAHAFSYFTIAIGLYLNSINHKLLGFISTLLTFPVGARVGILLSGTTIFNYYYFKIKKIGYKILMIGVILLIVFLAFVYLNEIYFRIIKMFQSATINIFDSDSQMAFLFTSGRNVIWNLAFHDFVHNSNIFEIIFGKGTFASVLFLEDAINNRIWLHNDFFDITYNMGLFGLSIYSYSIIKFFIKTKMYYFVFFLLVAAFSNGFFSYDAIYIIALFSMARLNEKTVQYVQ